MKTRHIISALALLLVIGTATAGFARGGFNHTASTLTPEQQQALTKVHTDADKRINPLREKAWALQTELQALSQNPATTQTDIKNLVNQIVEVRKQIGNEYKALNTKVEKDFGITHRGMHSMTGMADCGMKLRMGNHEGMGNHNDMMGSMNHDSMSSSSNAGHQNH